MKPPVPKKIKKLKAHGDTRIDNYYWLKTILEKIMKFLTT